MPVIFGQEIDKTKGAILLGVIVAGVAVIVYVRSRGGAGAPPDAAPQATAGPDYGAMGGGGGGGYTVQAPSDQAAANYNTALQDIQLQAARFGLERQAAEGAEQQRQWDLQDTLTSAYNQMQMALFGQNTQVGASRAGAEAARYGAEVAEYGRESATQIAVTDLIKSGKLRPECGKDESSYLDPNTGQWRCKPSGKHGAKAVESYVSGNVDWSTQVGRRAAEAWVAAQAGGPFAPKAKTPTPPGYTPPIAPQGGRGYA